jgi:hypothetical protein
MEVHTDRLPTIAAATAGHDAVLVRHLTSGNRCSIVAIANYLVGEGFLQGGGIGLTRLFAVEAWPDEIHK